MKRLAVIFIALSLGACSNISPPTRAPTSTTPSATATAPTAAQQPLQGLASFVTTDLQNALTMAKSNNDTVAAQCYTYLLPQVAAAQQQLGSITGSNISGGFSAFEAGRVATNNIKSLVNGVPQNLNVACAPLVVDAGSTLVALASKVGIIIALPTTLPIIGALP